MPRNAGTGVPNFSDDSGNSASKRGNRGFEGLAISGDGLFAGIVTFDTTTAQAIAQYANKLDTAAQGQGFSALVWRGDERFLVLERNNLGLGVGATLASADKAVYEIDLAGALDVSGLTLTAAFAGGVTKLANVIGLDAAALGQRSPERWEGLAIAPRLVSGQYLLLAGTDNDYSATQSGGGQQFDV